MSSPRARRSGAATWTASPSSVTASASLRGILARYNDFLMVMTAQSAGCNALHPLEARLARWLLQVHDRADGDRIALTQEFLSQMLGVRRTTLTLSARGLQSAGLIRYRRGIIDVLDRSGLEGKACECYATIRRHSEDAFTTTARRS